MSAPVPQPAPRFSEKLVTAIVLLAALALRIHSSAYGLDFEEPARAVHNIHLDERAMVFEEIELMRGDQHPDKGEKTEGDLELPVVTHHPVR